MDQEGVGTKSRASEQLVTGETDLFGREFHSCQAGLGSVVPTLARQSSGRLAQGRADDY